MSKSRNITSSSPDGAAPAKLDTGLCLKWGLAVLLPLATFLGCYAAGVEQQQCLFYGITSIALVLWALGLLSDAMVAISLPVAYIVVGIAAPRAVFGPWASSVGWIVLGGIIIGSIMTHTGLAKRLALWAMHITSGSFTRLLWGIMLACYLVAPVIPSLMGKTALICTICIGICEALQLEKKSAAASAVILAGFIGVSASKIGFLTGGADIAMYIGMMQEASGVSISWGEYFFHNFPLCLIYGPMSMFVMTMALRPKIDTDSREYVRSARKAIGTMTLPEKKTAGLILLLVVLLVTDRWHGIDAAWVIVLLAFAAFLPPLGLMDDAKMQRLPLASIFFVVGCMSIGSAAQAVQVDKSLAAMLAPMLHGSSELVSVLLAYMSGAMVNFLLTPLAALSSMTVPLTELALQLGMNPTPIMYAFSFGLDQYIFPYEFAVLLFFYATGWVNLKHIITVFSLRFVAAAIFLALVAMPYWKFLGLFEPAIAQ